MKYTIYALVFGNGKKYVGRTMNLNERIYGHRGTARRGSELPVASAIRLHKFNFDVLTLDTANAKNAAAKKERNYIERLNTIIPNGYNRSYGNAFLGCSLSKEHIHKIRLANSGKVRTPAMRKRYSFSKIGVPKTIEHKKRLSIALKGRPNLALSKKIKCSNGKTYISYADAARELGLSAGNICSVVRGERKTTGGLTFRGS